MYKRPTQAIDYIYVSLDKLIEASRNKYCFEAFAASVFIKSNIRSSRYKRLTDYKEVSQFFHIGIRKAERIINDLLEMDYADVENFNLLAHKVKAQKGLNVKFQKDKATYLADVVRELRKILILSKVSNLNFAANMSYKKKAAKSKKCSYKEYKGVRSTCRKYNVGDENVGISYSKLGAYSGVKNRNTLVRYIEELEKEERIKKENRNTLLYFGADAYNIYKNFSSEEIKHIAAEQRGTYKVNLSSKLILRNNEIVELNANNYVISDEAKSEFKFLRNRKRKVEIFWEEKKEVLAFEASHPFFNQPKNLIPY